jgi:hypothetical protein
MQKSIIRLLRFAAAALPLAAGALLAAGASSPAMAAPGPVRSTHSWVIRWKSCCTRAPATFGLELRPNVAPCTVNNFLTYVDSGRYDRSFVHRAVDGFVIQGGGYTYHSATDTFSSIVRDPAVVNEPGSSNIAGTIWMV